MTRTPNLNIITEAEYSKRVNQGRYVIKGEVKARGNLTKMHKLYDAQTKTLLCQMDVPLGVHRVLPDGTQKRPTLAQCSKHLRHFTHCIKTQNKLALSCSCPYLPPPVSTLVRGKTRALIIVPFAICAAIRYFEFKVIPDLYEFCLRSSTNLPKRTS